MYLLDADIIVWVSRKKKEIIQLLEKLVEDDKTGISTVAIAEVYAGIRPNEVEFVEKFFDRQEIIPVSRDIATQAGYFWQKYQKNLKNISLADCLMAATAKIQNSTLVTLNTKHFPMDDIKVISPTKLSSKR